MYLIWFWFFKFKKIKLFIFHHFMVNMLISYSIINILVFYLNFISLRLQVNPLVVVDVGHHMWSTRESRLHCKITILDTGHYHMRWLILSQRKRSWFVTNAVGTCSGSQQAELFFKFNRSLMISYVIKIRSLF